MEEKTEVKNAKITGTMLGTEDHGIMTAFVYLDYGGSGQGFGGFGLDTWVESEKRRVGTAWGCEFIKRVLATVGVEKWEDLPGKHVRALASWGHVEGIGNIIEDKWFYPKRDLAFLEKAVA